MLQLYFPCLQALGMSGIRTLGGLVVRVCGRRICVLSTLQAWAPKLRFEIR